MSNGLPINTIIAGDCLEVMREWPDNSVHCVVTSPPYWGLRDYGIEPSVWASPQAASDQWMACEHEWGEELPGRQRDNQHVDVAPGNKGGGAKHSIENQSTRSSGEFCSKCGAWRGSYGLEPTPTLFVEHTVTIFREVRRVLRDDGTLWLNLADSYCSTAPGTRMAGNSATSTLIRHARLDAQDAERRKNTRPQTPPGLKPKDLVGIPWCVAFALQADGWYLRQDIIWHKPNPMPESVSDRCTKAHEYIFLLTKSPRYFYDNDAIREPHAEPDRGHGESEVYNEYQTTDRDMVEGRQFSRRGVQVRLYNPSGRNKRSVWTVPTAPFKEAHFATFPPELVRPCIRAGTSAKGCCPKCGAPWERVLDKTRVATGPGEKTKIKVPGGWDVTPGAHGTIHREGRTEATYRDTSEVGNRDPGRHVTESTTIGWEPSCSCNAGDPVPCVVLDPFGGSGTTGMVAAQEHRDYVMIERNPKYVEMAKTTRLAAVETGVPAAETKAGQLALFGATP